MCHIIYFKINSNSNFKKIAQSEWFVNFSLIDIVKIFYIRMQINSYKLYIDK